MRLHRVIGYPVFAHRLFPSGDPFVILLGFSRLEVVPSREMAHEVSGIEARKLFFPDREGDDRNVIGRDARRGQFFVEADIRIAIDG